MLYDATMNFYFFTKIKPPELFTVHLWKYLSLVSHIDMAGTLYSLLYGGGLRLKGNIEQRAADLAVYIIENRATVRAAARKFGISKSTVHKDLSERLQNINRSLYLQVKEIMEINKAERHLRGGLATQKKYKEMARKKEDSL
jgi:putative DeoR family transcriptional regulator (stage III sporulation protein D)